MKNDRHVLFQVVMVGLCLLCVCGFLWPRSKAVRENSFAEDSKPPPTIEWYPTPVPTLVWVDVSPLGGGFDDVADWPVGNAKNGEELFTITYGCAVCHGAIGEVGSNEVGPWSGDFSDLGGAYPNGAGGYVFYTTEAFLVESILLPSAKIASDCPTGPCAGPPSGMPDNFGTRMSIQDMADMLAYLMQVPEMDTVENRARLTGSKCCSIPD